MIDPAPPATSRSLVGHMIGALRRPPPSGGRRPSAARDYRAALLLVAVTPAVIALAAESAAIAIDCANRAMETRAAGKIAARFAAREVAAAKARVAPFMTRPTVTGLAERLAGSLPDGAHVHAFAVDADGAVRAEIDCPDPDILRTALREDHVLGRLRMIQQAPAGDGVRVMLVSGRR